MAFIGLNPSTADANFDDPTMRRVIDFALRWGYGGLVMLNLFAFRSPNPSDLPLQSAPSGPENDATILRVADEAARVVVAWGKQPWRGVEERSREVVAMLRPRKLYAIALNENGSPRHPLYLKAELKPQEWTAPWEPQVLTEVPHAT